MLINSYASFEGCVVDTQTQGMVIAPLNMLWSDSLSEEGGYCVVTNKDCKVFGIFNVSELVSGSIDLKKAKTKWKRALVDFFQVSIPSIKLCSASS